MITPSFIHLHVHSDYSMVDGLAKVDQIVQKAVFLHMTSLAITDFNNLFGLIKFYNCAYIYGIKPIVGSDFLVKSKIMGDELTELTVLATNNIGYQNLILLISDAYKFGYISSIGPIIHRDWLIKYKEGLIILSGARKGDIGKCLIRGNMIQAEKCLSFYERYFPDYYYLEIIRTGRENEECYLHAAVELAIKYNLPLVATNDVRFINQDDFEAHEIRVAIHDGFILDDIKRPCNYSPQQYMRSEEEMCKIFSDLPEALINSIEISKRCNVSINLGKHFLPQFPTGNLSTKDYLIKYACYGLKKRLEFLFPDISYRDKYTIIYNKRLNNELKVINKMGFPGYFLIVMEFIEWAKNNSIPVGPGRGSGAGSLVAYALKITDINPLEFDLLFERFLNPDRISMPDLDVDFCMEKRDMVIDHVTEIYGRNAVSQIITFGTMAAKAAIRDVGRALGYPYSFVNRISKLVPYDPGITLEKSLLQPQIKIIYDTEEEAKILINMAKKLEGVIRNASKHAGGVVISPTKITDFTPIYCDNEGNNTVTQFDKNDIEYTGLVKFDFLGLRTLTIIHKALEMINARRIYYNLKPIDITSIPLNDKKSFAILQRSETTAIFQLESYGMKDLISRLKPDCFEDIIALVALFRPGPLQSGMVDNFINRKHGREIISYPDIKWQHLFLKPVLESTYGIILYQEQVMKIAQVLAGYTLGEADLLRRAMGKKQPEEMIKQRSIFKLGAEKIGIDNKLSMKIFDLVEKFAGYGFNKSHSTAYALVSYQTLWLKANYPAEFMAAAMTSDIDNTEKIVILVNECLRMNIKIIPPNINQSQYNFYVNQKKEIVYSIGAIKGVGKNHVDIIVNARHKYGHFNELFDLCSQSDIKKLNRRVLEKLIMAGAFDCLGTHRAALISSLNEVLKAADQNLKDKHVGQSDMFNISTDKIKASKKHLYKIVEPWPDQIVLNGELETLGFYLSGHPITQYLNEIKRYPEWIRIKDIYITQQGKIITTIGMVISTRIIANKKGNRVCICILDDLNDRLDIILYEVNFIKYYHFLEKNRIIIVQGLVSFDSFNKRLKIIVSKILDFSEVREKYANELSIYLTPKQINIELLNSLRLLLKLSKSGSIPVCIYYYRQHAYARLQFKIDYRVIPTDHLLNDLRLLIGNKQIKLKY